MWEAIAYVSSGFTLAAFIVAVIAWIGRTKIKERENLIGLAGVDDRKELVQSALEYFHVEIGNLSREAQFRIALEQIRARSRRFTIIALLIGFLAILAAIYSAYAVSTAFFPEPPEPISNVTKVIGIRYLDRLNEETPSATLSMIFADGVQEILTERTDAAGSGRDFGSAQVSKNCEYVVYSEFDDSNDDGAVTFDDSARIYLRDVQNSSSQLLTVDPSMVPSWSSDSVHVAYSDSRGNTQGEVWVLNVQSGERRQLTESANWAGHVKWSPDGRFISFYSADNFGSYLTVVRPDGTDYERLSPSVGNGWGAIWTRDNQIAFSMNTRENSGLFLASPDKSTIEPRNSSVWTQDRELCGWPDRSITY